MATQRASHGLLSHTSRGLCHGLRWSATRPQPSWSAARGYRADKAPRDRRQLADDRINFIYPTRDDVDTIPKFQPLEVRIEDSSVEVKAYSTKRTDPKWYALSPRWLRDHCKCTSCMNQETGQRQINLLKRTTDCTIQQVEGLNQGETIAITFGDGHTTTIPKQWVSGKGRGQTEARYGVTEVHTWDASVAEGPPSVQYEALQNEGLGQLMKEIRVKGFCFVEGTPPTPEATRGLLEAIGPIRNTHYGGFYDFTSDLSSKDTAYTSESLEPHTDNTYFTEPAGLQALHLLSHTEGTGGESSLVDGFQAARELFHISREHYLQLSTTGVYGHASGNGGISIQPAQAFPVLNHHGQLGSLMQVRWNNADRAGLHGYAQNFEEWYDAASNFDAFLSSPKNQYWFQLTPGKLLIFDNWRVLHGRAAFTGKRRMCGGYINHDDYISRYRQTNMSRGEIESSTVTG